MQNNIWMPIADLSILTRKCIDGAEQHGTAIELHHNPAEDIKADLHAVLALNNEYLLGEIEIAEEYKIYAELMANARAWTTLTRDTLKRKFGNKPNEQWAGAGFRGSLVVSKLFGPLSNTILCLSETLKSQPDLEVSALEITSGKGKEVYDDLTAKNHLITRLKVANADRLIARDKAVLTLRHRIRNLINELKQLIGLHNSLWLDFGLNIPGEVPRPTAPQEVEAKQITETAAEIRWKPSPHAKHYRVWKKVDGVDTEPVFVRRTREARLPIDDLPTDKEIELSVSAVNRKGESPRSQVTKVTLRKKTEAGAQNLSARSDETHAIVNRPPQATAAE